MTDLARFLFDRQADSYDSDDAMRELAWADANIRTFWDDEAHAILRYLDGDSGTLQTRLYDGEKAAGWDPSDSNSLPEEVAHLHEEVSEIFRAYRLTKSCGLTTDSSGKPQGVPAECADVAIGLFYIAERFGFDLLEAIETKHLYNLTRSYGAEGRRLHEPSDTSGGTR